MNPGSLSAARSIRRPQPRRRGRRGRLLALIGLLVAVTGAVLAVVLPGHRQRRAPPPGPLALPAAPTDAYVPPTRRHGRVESVTLVLPDGRALVLTYPPALGLAQLGVSFSLAVGWTAGTSRTMCCWSFVRLTRSPVNAVYSGQPKATYYSRAGSTVWLYDAAQRAGPTTGGPERLVFSFGPWLAEVDTQVTSQQHGTTSVMSNADKLMWVNNLNGSVTTDGYLRLRPHAPIAFFPPGAMGAVSVIFGHTDRGGLPQVLLDDGYCGQPQSDTARRRRGHDAGGPPYVSWCDPPSGLHVNASGPQPFVDVAASGLTLSTVAKVA